MSIICCVRRQSVCTFRSTINDNKNKKGLALEDKICHQHLEKFSHLEYFRQKM